MEDVIRKIIKIEEEAQTIMSTTLRENEAKRQESLERLKLLEEKILGDAIKKTKEIRKRELRENATYAKEIRSECDARLENMVVKVKKNEEEWVRYLVEKVLGD